MIRLYQRLIINFDIIRITKIQNIKSKTVLNLRVVTNVRRIIVNGNTDKIFLIIQDHVHRLNYMMVIPKNSISWIGFQVLFSAEMS